MSTTDDTTAQLVEETAELEQGSADTTPETSVEDEAPPAEQDEVRRPGRGRPRRARPPSTASGCGRSRPRTPS